MLAPLTASAFDAVDGLAHAVTTRAGGVSRAPYATLNVGLGSDDDRTAVDENRRRVASHLGFDNLVTPYQVHGDHIVVANDASIGRPRGDALMTNRPGVLLGVLGADCPGVLLVDAAQHALAVVHAGWRGVAAGIVRKTIDALAVTYATRVEELRVLIGPGIGMARYEVSDDVVDAIARALPEDVDVDARNIAAPTRPGHAQLSLTRTIHAQLVARGIAEAHVHAIDLCTFDEADRLFSYRRDGPSTGRHALVAGWRD
ncbi:MAG: peptidoglycan editing factor PgeF [Planctomycetota bacterium]|nr:peptidoglycan editing factor PgeF [Planctomycetota bacterium]